MRGKFITTNLKLAVLAGGKRSKLLSVKETKASLENFELIWSKPSSAVQKGAKGMQATEAIEMVF